jgi:hypothetical protein
MKRIAILATVLAILGIVSLASATIKDTTLFNINTWNGVSPGDSVRVTNIVITGIDTNPTTYGFWAQEQASPECGMLIYMGSLYPTYLKRGEIMRATGRYTEYPGPDTANSAAEINSFYSWQLDSLGMGPVPDPLLMSCKDLGYWPADAPRAEPWEGLLIRVDTVIVVNGAENYPRSYIIREAHRGAGNHGGAGLGDTVYVRNDKMDLNAPTRLADNDTLASLTGAWYFEYGEYRLCPRDADDIVPLHPVPPHVLRAFATRNDSIKVIFDIRVDQITAETVGNYSLGRIGGPSITNAKLDPIGEQIVTLATTAQTPGQPQDVTAKLVRSKTGTPMATAETYAFREGLCPMSLVQTPGTGRADTSQYYGEEVTVAGIVTGDKTIYTTEFYVENTPGGTWSGLKIYGGIPTPVAQGDSVIVAGFATEYYNDTEITPVHYLRIVSSGNSVPGPNLITLNMLNNASSPSAERWEGVFVNVNTGVVRDTTGFNGFGEWTIWNNKSAADTALIGHTGKYTFIPSPGRALQNIQGPVSYTYNHYRIEPRTNADIDTILVRVGDMPKPQVFALEQNAPNPFNPVTTIFFSIPERAEVELYVCDVTGRVVKTLVDKVPMGPGRHKATWDGRNDAGRAVSSGVYFCKLSAADKVAQMKMVILK